MSSAASVRSQNTFKVREDDRRTLHPSSPSHISQQDFMEEEGDSEVEQANLSYSSQMDEIMSGEEEDEEEDEEMFVYSGVDAPQLSGYSAQMADVLGEDQHLNARESFVYPTGPLEVGQVTPSHSVSSS